MLRIDRKAHPRKGTWARTKTGKQVFRSGSNVDRTVYMAEDRGKKGRGEKVIVAKEPGSLKKFGYDPDAAEDKRRDSLRKAIDSKEFSEKELVGKLRALQVWNKRTNPALSRRAKLDAKYVSEKMK